MSNIVPASVTANFLVPSSHTIQSAFNEGVRDYTQQLNTLELQQRTATAKAVVKATELDDTADISAVLYDSEAHTLKNAAKARRKLRLDAATGKLLLVAGGVLAIIVLAVVMVDFSILHDLFSVKFADRFGDVPTESAGLLALAALQGALAMLSYKVVLSSERSLKIASLAVLTMLVIYGLGLLLDQGFADLAEATVSTSNRFGFGIEPAAVTTPELQPMQILSIFALGIPLVLLPLVGGLFAAIAQRLIAEAVKRQIEWSLFNVDHREMMDHAYAAETFRGQKKQLQARRVEIVQAPARRQIDEAFGHADQLLNLTARAEIAGDETITVPGPGGTVITNIELAKALAVQARNTLEGYLQREFANWISTNPQWRS